MSMTSPPRTRGDGDLRGGQLRRHRVAIAAVGHQRLPGDGPRLAQHHRIRARRHRRQRFADGDGQHRGLAVGGGPHPGIGPQTAEPIHAHLGLLDRGVVRQSSPPPLYGSVISLPDHAFAVPGPRWADRDRHAVVLGDPGEGGGDLPAVGVTFPLSR